MSWCLGLPPRSGGCHSCACGGLGPGLCGSLCPCFVPGARAPGSLSIGEIPSQPPSTGRWQSSPSSLPLECKYVKDSDLTLGITFSKL